MSLRTGGVQRTCRVNTCLFEHAPKSDAKIRFARHPAPPSLPPGGQGAGHGDEDPGQHRSPRTPTGTKWETSAVTRRRPIQGARPRVTDPPTPTPPR